MDINRCENVRLRLNDYILQRGVKCKFIADKCHICPARLSRFINNKRNINEDILNKLDEFLEVNYNNMNN